MKRSVSLAALLLLAACGDGGTGTPQPRENGAIVNSQADREPNDRIYAKNGGTVELRRGQTFSFTLSSNETTGYSWNVAEHPRFLSWAGPRYRGPSAGPDGEVATGAGGSALFRFRAERAGEGTLRLEYRGPGSEDQLASTFELRIRAR